MRSAELAASVAHCRGVARRSARNFYYGFFPLSRPQHDAMCALYAFARYTDDISDDDSARTSVERAEALEKWGREVEAAFEGRHSGNLILPAFQEAVQRFAIPRGYVWELIEGVRSDLEGVRFDKFDDLYRYCYRVAATIGLMCLHIFGFRSPEAPVCSEKLGVAFQLTNILRDLREDAGRGRLYLPAEDLERFGVEPADLAAGRVERVRELLRFEADRAERYYQEAAPLLDLVEARSRASLWIMTAIYHGILQRVRESGYDVFSHRAGLSQARKTGILLRGLLIHFTGGTVPFPA
jgi:phytoene synthase